MQKNVASQKWIVFAFDRTDNTPKTGDATNITANLRLDGGGANAVDDTNPTELEDGYYVFDLTQAETGANMILISPESSTGNIQVIGVPGVVYTTPPNFPVMGIESDGDMTKVNSLDSPSTYKADVSALPTKVEQDTSFNMVMAKTNNIPANPATEAKQDTMISDVGDIATKDQQDTSFNTVITNINALPTKTEQDTSFNTVITDLDNPDQYKADVSAIATKAEQDTSFNTVIGDISALPTKAQQDTSFNTIITDLDNPDQYKADISALPTKTQQDTSFNSIPELVWDEILTAATHNIATSAGRRLREIAAIAIHTGTAQAGTATTITLAADADGGNGIFNRNLIVIIGGTGLGQTRTIADYNDTSKVCIIDREWRIDPDDTSEYQILADDTPLIVDQGVAQSGTETTITLRDYASSINDTYLCNIIIIIGGTGRGQARLVGAYNGTSKVATLCGDNWVTIPDNTSVYVMVPFGTTCTSCIGTHALSQINTECDTALTDYDAPTKAEMDVSFNTIIAKTNDLPSGVPKNIALPNFAFLMTDASDNSPKTGLTVTMQLSKDGAAFTGSANSAVEIANGLYKIDLTQAEMNAGIIVFKATAAGANQSTLVLVTST